MGQVTEETEGLRFNTAIAAMMEFVNGANKWPSPAREVLEGFTLLLAPYAPHLAEELWQVGWGPACTGTSLQVPLCCACRFCSRATGHLLLDLRFSRAAQGSVFWR